jgi:hypothetical protein
MYSNRGNGPPTWFVFLLAVVIIFGGYYLWLNLQQFMRSGGLSVAAATQQAQEQVTATAIRQIEVQSELPTRRPTSTPRPACQDFEVTVASGIVRERASTESPLLESLDQGAIVCVLSGEEGADGFTWYLIDQDPITSRIETGYMREDVIRPLNPSPTPSDTATMPPTITPTSTPTLTPTAEVREAETATPAPSRTTAPTITPTPTSSGVNI